MTREIERVLPRAAWLRPAERYALCGAFFVLVALLGFTAANAILGFGGATLDPVLREEVSSTLYVLVGIILVYRAIRVPVERLGFGFLATGVCLYGLGNVLWATWIGNLPDPPIPSFCDSLRLSFYPFAAVGLVALSSVRGRHRAPLGVWLDGIVVGVGLAAIGATVVLSPALAAPGGDTLTRAVDLCYPLGDLLLVGLVLGAIAIRGWRMDSGWLLMIAACCLLSVADCVYAIQVAQGAKQPSPDTNLLYVVSMAAIAFASWQAPPDRPRRMALSNSVLFVPIGFAVAALGLLLASRIHRLNDFAFGLATTTLFIAVFRMAVAFRDAAGLSEARHLAATDDLTELPNRRQFMRRVRSAIQEAVTPERSVTVLMLDLDNFKQLNDTLGHQAGDALLRMIGPRLEEIVSSNGIVARLGGDEFAVMLSPSPAETDVVAIARRLLDSLREPFRIQGLALRVTGSLGIASFPGDSEDLDSLMRNADIAMYQAKESRNRYEFYAKERNTNSRERLAIAAELTSALEHDGIEVYFQPKIHVGSGEIAGVEALARWRHDDGHLVPPLEFIVAAERAGLSRTLTARVVDLALAQLRRWMDAGHTLHVAVNTTVADLLDEAFPGEISAALQRHGLPPEALVLEITESSVLADPDRIGVILARLRGLGVALSLDDFGTGYSSLAHLKALPVSEVKIDRSFVTQMCSDATDGAIVYAMIRLAAKLGMRVVAEGVEDEEALRALRELGCDLIQGFLVSRPVPASELDRQLDARRASVSVTAPRRGFVAGAQPRAAAG